MTSEQRGGTLSGMSRSGYTYRIWRDPQNWRWVTEYRDAAGDVIDYNFTEFYEGGWLETHTDAQREVAILEHEDRCCA